MKTISVPGASRSSAAERGPPSYAGEAERYGRVRYRWSNIKPRSYTWEQAFSTDGGKTWETNWITQGTRID